MSSSSSDPSPAAISVRRSSFLPNRSLSSIELLADDAVDPLLVAEDLAKLADPLLEVGVVVGEPLPLETRKRPQAHVEDRLGLDLGEGELLDQRLARLVGRRRAADRLDHRVEVVQRDQEAFEDVRAAHRVAQLVLEPPRDDLALVVEVVADELEQRQRARDAVDERDGVVAERRLQRRVLVELVEGDLRDRVALELDLDPHAGLVGEVLDRRRVRDLGDHAVADEAGDLVDHAVVAALLHAVGQLGHDDRRLAAAELLDVRARPDEDPAPAGAIGLADALAAQDDAAGREVRALQVAAQPVDVCRRVVDEGDDRVDDLAEVVRRHVRRHPDRDAGRAVDEEVREPGREDRRLLRRAVVVRLVVDRVVPDVAEQLHRHRGQAALGVALGGCGIPVDVAEVPLRVDSG